MNCSVNILPFVSAIFKSSLSRKNIVGGSGKLFSYFFTCHCHLGYFFDLKIDGTNGISLSRWFTDVQQELVLKNAREKKKFRELAALPNMGFWLAYNLGWRKRSVGLNTQLERDPVWSVFAPTINFLQPGLYANQKRPTKYARIFFAYARSSLVE